MRIQDISCYLVEEPEPLEPFRWRDGVPGHGGGASRVAYVRVDTDEGITGCVRMEQGDAVLSFVRRRLKALVGEDPLMTERLWRLIWEIDRIEEMQLCQLAILDLIAWDIKSRKAGLPLYRLLGGHHNRVPALCVDRDLGNHGRLRTAHQAMHRCRLHGLQASRLGRAQGRRRARPQSAALDRPRCQADVRRLGRMGLCRCAPVRPRAPGRGLFLVRGADARIRADQLPESSATRSTFPSSRRRPPTAAIGTRRPGSRWAHSTCSAPTRPTRAGSLARSRSPISPKRTACGPRCTAWVTRRRSFAARFRTTTSTSSSWSRPADQWLARLGPLADRGWLSHGARGARARARARLD